MYEQSNGTLEPLRVYFNHQSINHMYVNIYIYIEPTLAWRQSFGVVLIVLIFAIKLVFDKTPFEITENTMFVYAL